MKRKKTVVKKTCENCNHLFKPNTKVQKFCSMVCSNRYNGLKARSLSKPRSVPAVPQVEETAKADKAYLSEESTTLLKALEAYLRYNDTDMKAAFGIVAERHHRYDNSMTVVADMKKEIDKINDALASAAKPDTLSLNAIRAGLARIDEDIKTQNSLILKIAERLFFLESELGVKPASGARH